MAWLGQRLLQEFCFLRFQTLQVLVDHGGRCEGLSLGDLVELVGMGLVGAGSEGSHVYYGENVVLQNRRISERGRDFVYVFNSICCYVVAIDCELNISLSHNNLTTGYTLQ